MELVRGARIGEYELELRLGSGAVGEVWRARHQRLGLQVAIKALAPHLAKVSAFRSRFLQEGIALAKLVHPNIVGIHDIISTDETDFIVMTYVDGPSLHDRLRTAKSLPIEEALPIARDILGALDYAHQTGVIHRDVKPSNILLSTSGRAYLSDFGIARVLSEQRLTAEGTLMGTIEYMSPEQIVGKRDIDHRADVYSFGCVLYEMLAGKPPFGARDHGQTEFSIMQAHAKQSAPALPAPKGSPEARATAIIERSLAKSPEGRFAGCSEMAEALDTAVARPQGTHRQGIGVLVGVTLCALVAGGWLAVGPRPWLETGADGLERQLAAGESELGRSRSELETLKQQLAEVSETLKKVQEENRSLLAEKSSEDDTDDPQPRPVSNPGQKNPPRKPPKRASGPVATGDKPSSEWTCTEWESYWREKWRRQGGGDEAILADFMRRRGCPGW